MRDKVRVRFAPSPTGYLHIGGLRAAIFNWLFANHNNGKFLLRIEDTDRERSKDEYLKSIIDSLAWADITSDEPIVIQSKLIQNHLDLIKKLLDAGKAYKCYCLKAECDGEGYYYYDNKCRTVTEQPEGTPYVVRFKVPDSIDQIKFIDLIRGEITINRDQIDDFIILRSDNTPTYNFVVVVDDVYMKITHVLRGEDHISNTFKQILLYQALGFEIPKFGHLPLILGPDGTRLSKRHGATSVDEFRARGYLPDALFNYLVRLGWSHGDQEIFSRDELIKYFTLDAVGKKSSVFDIEKLNWVNQTYIKTYSDQKLQEYITAYIDKDFVTKTASWSSDQRYSFIELYKERFETVKELAKAIVSLHNDAIKPDSESLKEWANSETISLLGQVVDRLEKLGDFTELDISSMIKELSKENNVKLAMIAQPLRIAITGTNASPSIFSLICLLGREETKSRIKNLIKKLS